MRNENTINEVIKHKIIYSILQIESKREFVVHFSLWVEISKEQDTRRSSAAVMKVDWCNGGEELLVAEVEAIDLCEVHVFDSIFVRGAEQSVRQVVDGRPAVYGAGVESDAAESGPVLEQPADRLRVYTREMATRAAVRPLARLVAEAEICAGSVVPAAPPAAVHEDDGVLWDASEAALVEAQVVDAHLVVRVARLVDASLDVDNYCRPEERVFRNLMKSRFSAWKMARRVYMSARVFRSVHFVRLNPSIHNSNVKQL